MISFFYLIGFLITLLNLSIILQYNKFEKVREWTIKFKKVTNKDPKKSDYKFGNQGDLTLYRFILNMDFLWLFFGLLTNNIYLYISVGIISYIISIISKVIGDFTKISKLLGFIKIIIITLVIGITSLNHFHGSIDLWNLIKNYLNFNHF